MATCFTTRWVTIHDTDDRRHRAVRCQRLAKSKGGTPFKRPENGLFRPGTTSAASYFNETGDTNADTEAGSAYGGFGSILQLDQPSAAANSGTLRARLPRRRRLTAGFDNIAFWADDQVVFVEDAGDTAAHAAQRARLGLRLRPRTPTTRTRPTQPVRLLAQGRDASATSTPPAGNGFQNDGDNEITGIHVSTATPAGRPARRRDAAAVRGRLARLLHAAARRQRDLRDRSQPAERLSDRPGAGPLDSRGPAPPRHDSAAVSCAVGSSVTRTPPWPSPRP